VSCTCTDRVVVVTGAGRGIGRAHALAFAARGAKVVVNDVGVGLDGADPSTGPAQQVVDQITAGGGHAVANTDDVADFGGAGRLVEQAVHGLGGLDVLVNNAGFLRDRMLVSLGEEEWDAVVRVHLKGHFAPLHHAARYWRERAKAGEAVDARVVNTSSGAGLLGSIGQGNYSAAKAGIAGLTLVAAAELGRYGTDPDDRAAFADLMATPHSGFDAMAPENISPLVVWLGSLESRGVTGRVFEVEGGRITVAEGWRRGPSADKQDRWDPDEVGAVVEKLLADATPPDPVYGA
jgi:NAD(P)-dependent dehydrogenase (short-subunit alcohol dehydrogenase family)